MMFSIRQYNDTLRVGKVAYFKQENLLIVVLELENCLHLIYSVMEDPTEQSNILLNIYHFLLNF